MLLYIWNNCCSLIAVNLNPKPANPATRFTNALNWFRLCPTNAPWDSICMYVCMPFWKPIMCNNPLIFIPCPNKAMFLSLDCKRQLHQTTNWWLFLPMFHRQSLRPSFELADHLETADYFQIKKYDFEMSSACSELQQIITLIPLIQ